MAIKKKGIKRKPNAAVVRRISVPAGTREIVVHITIGPRTGVLKMAKSGIDDNPLGGGG